MTATLRGAVFIIACAWGILVVKSIYGNDSGMLQLISGMRRHTGYRLEKMCAGRERKPGKWP